MPDLGSHSLKQGKRPSSPPSLLSVKAGSLIFKEGDRSQDVYIIKSGLVSICQRRGNQEVELAELGERAVFGEMSLMDNRPRSASARAKTPCELLAIAPATFQEVLQQIPAWLQAVLKTVNHRLRETNQKVDQRKVKSPLTALVLFLVQHPTLLHPPPSVPKTPQEWLPFLDEFMHITLLSREEVMAQMRILESRQLLKLSRQTEFTILDYTGLQILLEWLRCLNNGIEFVYTSLDSLTLDILGHLILLNDEDLSNVETLRTALKKQDQRIEISHINRMISLEALIVTPSQNLEPQPNRIAYILKANQEFNRITGKGFE